MARIRSMTSKARKIFFYRLFILYRRWINVVLVRLSFLLATFMLCFYSVKVTFLIANLCNEVFRVKLESFVERMGHNTALCPLGPSIDTS